MLQLKFESPRATRALEAVLTIRKQQPDVALRNLSVDQVFSPALQEQIKLLASKSAISEDVSALLGPDEFFNAVWRRWNSDGDIPESIVVELEKRAGLVSIPAGE